MERRAVAVTVRRANLQENKTCSSQFLWRLPDFILKKMIHCSSTTCHFKLFHQINIFFYLCCHWGLWFCCFPSLKLYRGKDSRSILLLEVGNMYFAFLLVKLKYLSRFSSEFSQIIYFYQTWGMLTPQEKPQRTFWVGKYGFGEKSSFSFPALVSLLSVF